MEVHQALRMYVHFMYVYFNEWSSNLCMYVCTYHMTIGLVTWSSCIAFSAVPTPSSITTGAEIDSVALPPPKYYALKNA